MQEFLQSSYASDVIQDPEKDEPLDYSLLVSNVLLEMINKNFIEAAYDF